MPFLFNVEKTMQAVVYILEKAPHKTCSRKKLLKLLFFCERESLRQLGKTITGDAVFAMGDGPVLSNTYDFFKGQAPVSDSRWFDFIEVVRPHFVRAKSNPGTGRLSPFETDLLDWVWNEYGHLSANDLSVKTHQLPEWEHIKPENRATSRRTRLSELLTGVGRSDDADWLEEEAQYHTDFNRMIRGLSQP